MKSEMASRLFKFVVAISGVDADLVAKKRDVVSLLFVAVLLVVIVAVRFLNSLC